MMAGLSKWLAMAGVIGVIGSQGQLVQAAAAKLDCSPATNKAEELPRSMAIGTNCDRADSRDTTSSKSTSVVTPTPSSSSRPT